MSLTAEARVDYGRRRLGELEWRRRYWLDRIAAADDVYDPEPMVMSIGGTALERLDEEIERISARLAELEP